VKYHFVIINKSGCIDENVLLILYAATCCHTQLVIYVCFVAAGTSIWIILLCNWMQYEQVTKQGFDSWQTRSGAHPFFYSVCTRAFVQGWNGDVKSLLLHLRLTVYTSWVFHGSGS